MARVVAVGSTNPVKIAAVRGAVRKVWPRSVVVAVDAASGVSEQPRSDEESIAGATNRARHSLQATDADLGVGIEAGIVDTAHGMFVTGWSVVVDRNGTVGIGGGGRLLLPEFIARALRVGGELGPQMDRFTGLHDVKRNQGTVGVLTNGLINRTEALETSVIYALTRFINPDYYQNGGEHRDGSG